MHLAMSQPNFYYIMNKNQILSTCIYLLSFLGLLATPAKKYPAVFTADGAFGQFPYLLPSLIVGGACVLVLVIDIFLLPETKSRRSGPFYFALYLNYLNFQIFKKNFNYKFIWPNIHW